MIFAHYRNNPLKFEQDFGYSMYTDIDGKQILNGDELILDMYLYLNSNLCRINDENFFYFNSSDSYNGMTIQNLETENNLNFITFLPENKEHLNNFFAFKNIDIIIEAVNYGEPLTAYNHSFETMFSTQIQEKVSDGLNDGKLISIGMIDKKDYAPITYIPGNNNIEGNLTTSNWKGEGHIVFVTGIDSEYIYIASWGLEWKVSLKDFEKGYYEFNFIDIKSKKE